MGKMGTYTLVRAHTQAWYLTRSVIDTGLDLENHCHSSLCRSNSHIISHKGKRDGENKGGGGEGGGKACSSVKCFLVFHKRRATSLKTHPSLSSMKRLHATSQETDAGVRPPVTPAVNTHVSLLISERGTNKSCRRYFHQDASTASGSGLSPSPALIGRAGITSPTRQHSYQDISGLGSGEVCVSGLEHMM